MNAHNITRFPKLESVLVTPEMAEDWLSHAIYERQRRRADWHVKRLANEIELGRFVPGTQIHFAVLDGKRRLVNGQHTLAAIARSQIPVQLSVLSTTVENDKEIGELYGRHDRHRGRTPHDAFLGMNLASELEMEEREVNALGAAVKYVENGFRRVSVTRCPERASLDWLAERMKAWAPHARDYFDCVRDARVSMKSAYRRAPVVAIGLVTIGGERSRQRALDFWTGAAADDGLTKNDPRRSLNEYLTRNSSGHGDPIIYMRNVAACWNKFYEGGELQFVRPGDGGKYGVTIRGTKYKAVKPKTSVKIAVVEPEDDETSPAAPAQMYLSEAIA